MPKKTQRKITNFPVRSILPLLIVLVVLPAVLVMSGKTQNIFPHAAGNKQESQTSSLPTEAFYNGLTDIEISSSAVVIDGNSLYPNHIPYTASTTFSVTGARVKGLRQLYAIRNYRGFDPSQEKKAKADSFAFQLVPGRQSGSFTAKSVPLERVGDCYDLFSKKTYEEKAFIASFCYMNSFIQKGATGAYKLNGIYDETMHMNIALGGYSGQKTALLQILSPGLDRAVFNNRMYVYKYFVTTDTGVKVTDFKNVIFQVGPYPPYNPDCRLKGVWCNDAEGYVKTYFTQSSKVSGSGSKPITTTKGKDCTYSFKSSDRIPTGFITLNKSK